MNYSGHEPIETIDPPDLRHRPAHERSRLEEDVDQLLATDAAEELVRAIAEEFGCAYDPAAEGLSWAEWLAELRLRLPQRISERWVEEDGVLVQYTGSYIALHELEGRPAYTWDDAPTSRWQQRCLFCESPEVVKVHMLEDPTFRDEGDEYTLSAFVTLCAACEALAERRDLDALTELIEDQPHQDQGRLIAEAFLRADRGGRDLGS